MKKILRLGSRGSPLALLQAEEVRKKILDAHPTFAQDSDIEIVPIRTSGDWRSGQKELSFRDIGGNKELFTKEIEDALLGGHIDMAVHSMKDVASWLPPGLEITTHLDRIDPRDAFIGRAARTLAELPEGATLGTSSLRRQAQILAVRPDLKVVPLRGNVETRLKKLADGFADATLLAMAGLIRLGLQHVAGSVLEPNVMLPAAAQGALGIESRQGDEVVLGLLESVNSRETSVCVIAERACLRMLDGSCHTPIGILAQWSGVERITIEGLVAKADGSSIVRLSLTGAAEDAEALGLELGSSIKGRLPLDFFAA